MLGCPRSRVSIVLEARSRLHHATGRRVHGERAMTHPIQTTVGFRDTRALSLRVRHVWRDARGDSQLRRGTFPRSTSRSPTASGCDASFFRTKRASSTMSGSSSADASRFPVRGHSEPFNYGVWLSLSRDSFARYYVEVDDVNRRSGRAILAGSARRFRAIPIHNY